MIPNCGIVRRILPIYRIWWYVITSILRFLFANCVVAHWNISLFLFQPLSFFSVILCSILINVPQASASLDDEGLCDSIWFHSILSRFNSFLPIRTKPILFWESPKAHRHCFLRRIPCSGSNIIRFYGFWLQCLPLDWSGFWRHCMPMQCYVCIWMASMLMLMFILVLVMIAMMLSHSLRFGSFGYLNFLSCHRIIRMAHQPTSTPTPTYTTLINVQWKTKWTKLKQTL